MSGTDCTVRPAQPEDLVALVTLENACFDSDRLSKRSFRYQLQHSHNVFLVAEQEGQLVAYVLVLLRRGTSLARLYSIAVSDRVHGQGMGRHLLLAAEQRAAERGRMFMRLEVRKDNTAAIGLYTRLGYKQFGTYQDYYEDHADALRFQKQIIPQERVNEHRAAPRQVVPYYEQTTEFTCGAAALMMAMRFLRSDQPLDQRTELQLWREATTIFMTSGHGGCGPHGLAYAARKRGFQAEVYTNQSGPLFVEGVRNEGKKQILQLVHEDFLVKLSEWQVPIHYEALSLPQMQWHLQAGSMLLILISTYRFDRRKAPHWVLVVDMDEQFVFINDPDSDDDGFASALDRHYLPIPRASFDMMSTFGQNRLRCAVVVSSAIS